MGMRLINADALKTALQEKLQDCTDTTAKTAYAECIELLDNAKTIRPTVGHWEILPPCFEAICYCSVCHTEFKQALQHTKSCPSCGAIMLGCR